MSLTNYLFIVTGYYKVYLPRNKYTCQWICASTLIYILYKSTSKPYAWKICREKNACKEHDLWKLNWSGTAKI